MICNSQSPKSRVFIARECICDEASDECARHMPRSDVKI